MPFYRKTDQPGIGYEWTETCVDLVAHARRLEAARTDKPTLWIRIGNERTWVYIGSRN